MKPSGWLDELGMNTKHGHLISCVFSGVCGASFEFISAYFLSFKLISQNTIQWEADVPQTSEKSKPESDCWILKP